MLEPRDRRILAELQRDSRLTNQELADKVGMSNSATWRRVKSLEESGVIERYTAIVDPKKAGFGLASMVHVSLARHEQTHVEHFVREVLQHPRCSSVLRRVARPIFTCGWLSKTSTPTIDSWTSSYSSYLAYRRFGRTSCSRK